MLIFDHTLARFAVALALLVCMAISRAQSIELLLQDLQGGDERARAVARQMLPLKGARSVPELVRLIEHADERVWRAASNVLRDIANRLATPGHEAERALVAAEVMKLVAPEKPAAVKERGLQILPCAVPEGFGVGPVAALLDDSELAMKARGALFEMGTAEARAALRAKLETADPAFQRALLDSLGELRDMASVPAILARIRSDDAGVRSAAARALAWTGDPGLFDAMVYARDHAEDATRFEAEDALLRYADALAVRGGTWDLAMDVYTQTLERSANPVILGAALVGLGTYGDERAVHAILAGRAAHADKDLDHAVIAAFDALRGANANAALAEAWPDVPEPLRPNVVAVFARRQDARLLPILAEASRSNDAALRMAALRGLTESRLPEAVNALADAALNAGGDDRAVAVEGLKNMAERYRSQGAAAPAGRAFLTLYKLAADSTEKEYALKGLWQFPIPDAFDVLLESFSPEKIGELPPSTLTALAKALHQAGRTDDANRARAALMARLDSKEAVQAAIGLARELGGATAHDFGFVTSWSIVGPFPFSQAEGFTRTHINEPAVDLNATYSVDGEERTWRTAETEDLAGIIELSGIYGEIPNACAYAFTRVYVSEAVDVSLRIGSDDGVKVWVNGEVVHENNTDRGLALDQDNANAKLKAGENTILLQVTQGAGGWAFCLRLIKADGGDLKFSAEPLTPAPPAPKTSAPTTLAVDLRGAVIVPAPLEGVVLKAAEMLRDELEKRSGVALSIAPAAPAQGPAILIGTADTVSGGAPPAQPEAYTITVEGQTVKLVGRDARGAMFAAGRLIRLADYGNGALSLDLPAPIAAAPDVPYRAHQLGYRNTANTYDAWDVNTYEQYIRDLILFGCNGIELIPNLDKDAKDGPVMAETMHAMNIKLSALIASYGLDVWVWLPVGAEPSDDVTTPEGAQRGWDKRRAIFADYPVVNHIYVPGGDDGETPAEHFLPFVDGLAPVLRESQPGIKIWVSNQTFTDEENNFFFDYLKNKDPEWLTGVIYGPWTAMSPEEMRERTPKRFLMRLCPDITHTVRCQYPVQEWDPIFANTLGREPINPMPKAHRHICLRYRGVSDGFVTYSDGTNDDLNKVIWAAYGWDAGADLDALLEEYGKLWWGSALAKDVARGLAMLEENWIGSIRENPSIPEALALWEDIAARCPDFDSNWRAQMYLFRARFDAYVQEKARVESEYEAQALAALANARETGAVRAITAAREALAQADTPCAPELRAAIERLGRTLLGSIGYQFSVHEPYNAKNPERGAMLDWLDQPVNDRPWLEQRFDAILAITDGAAQLAAIDEIVHWTDPGPGGFYDNLGAVGEFSHVVYQRTWEQDPSGANSPRSDFPYYKADPEEIAAGGGRQELRMSWQSQIVTHYGVPLKMRYEGLDPGASYRLKVTYAGRYRPTMTLTANASYRIHGPVPQPNPIWPLEYYIPQEATKSGTLDLEWNLVDGRGCMVSEVWLMPR